MRMCNRCKALYMEVTIPRSRREDVRNGKYCPDYKWRCHLGYKVDMLWGKRFHYGWCPHPSSFYRLNKERKKRDLPCFIGCRHPYMNIKYRIIDNTEE